MAAAAADDDRRQGACGKRYVDYTIIFASFPANLSSLLLVFAGKEEGQEQGRGGRRRKEEEEEEEEEVVVVVAAASDKGVQEKEATAEEESAHNEVAEKNIGEFFDMFYLRLPLTSNFTFIIFVPGLLRYSYDAKQGSTRSVGGGATVRHRQEGQ